ncbi:MAG: TolC family protein [Ideonella sp.]|nr:TolC family protein [Ideonella sp.]MCC7456499.1 TolC family protein [Nitrospira sp.]
MPSPRATRLRVASLLLASALFATGCASWSPDGGLAPVQHTASQRLGKDVLWARTPAEQQHIDQRVTALLQQQPLAADAAVQLALLNNRGLQARLFALGIGEAELVQSRLLPNPGFSFARLTRGDEVELERGVHFNLARLIAWPAIQRVEQQRFAQTQADVAAAVLALAADARQAWTLAVAAEASVHYARQVMRAAEAGAELAQRMAQVGNFSRLQQAREQAFHADAALGLARAQQAQQATRERLVRTLGLWGDAAANLRLPERLPDLPAEPKTLPDVERTAIAQRLDVEGARLMVQQTARSLGLTRTTRFVNVLELGLQHNGSNEAPTQRGWEVTLELPLFDWGGARSARAESVYLQALQQAAATAIAARSEAREAYGTYRSAWDIARHVRDEIVPLRRRIGDENVLRYNGMLIGVFELLADARAQIAAVQASLDALRDFWLAQAALDNALIGTPGAIALPVTTTAAGDSDAAGGH